MNWLKTVIADYENFRDRIDQLARENPLPFKSWFDESGRAYIPFNSEENLFDDNVQDALMDFGCEITDYKGGYCAQGKRTWRIGKALESARKQALQQIQEKYQRGEIYDQEREITETNSFFDEAINTFVTSNLRVDKAENQFYIVISQDPHDIAMMSTDRDWGSCMTLGRGLHHNDVYCEVRQGGLIAYLIRGNDKNIEKPLARIHIRRFDNKNGNSIAIQEQSIYGNDIDGFSETVKQWITERQQDISPGFYRRQGGEYSDTFSRSMLVAPENPEGIIKWLRGEDEDAVYSTWIVKDNLYDTEVAWDEEKEEETEFDTKEEAEQYVSNMWTNDSWRDYYGEEWIEQDEETGEYINQRYDIHENVNDYRGEMLSQALKKIFKAKKGTYPEEVINEAVAKVKEQYSVSPQNTMMRLLAEYYPEYMDDAQIKDVDKRLYYKKIREMEEGPRKDQLINDEVEAAESWLLPSLEEVAEKDKTHDLQRIMQILRMATDVQTRVNAERNIASRWYAIFSDNVLNPLQEIYGDHKIPRPLPEGIVQKLVNFATTTLPNYSFSSATQLSSMDKSIGRKRSLEHTDQTQADIVHLFSMSGADSPTVQNFYKSLLPKWGLYDVSFDEVDDTGKRLPSKRSEINIQSLGWPISSLGENGRQFLPFMKKKLQEAEQMYAKAIEEQKTEHSIYKTQYKIKAAKKNIERHLYVIDALEKGKPSGKYRFSSINWLYKARK